MLASELISETVSSLRPDEVSGHALQWMRIYRISHLAMVDEKVYLGLLSESDILDTEGVYGSLTEIDYSRFRPFVYSNQHLFEVVEMFSLYKLSFLPVLDVNQAYLGGITQEEVINNLAKLITGQSRGAILELLADVVDFSFTYLARIIESNDAKILAAYMDSTTTPGQVKITLKLDTIQTLPITSQLEQNLFQVVSVFRDDPRVTEMYTERLEALRAYLSV